MNNPGSASVVKGAAWMLSFRLIDKVLGVISILVLTRLLVPADFGLVAMATAVVALVDLFGSFNVDLALINRREIDSAHLDTAWTLNVLAGAVVGALVLILAYPAGLFYSEPRLPLVMCALAVTPILQGAENIGIVYFRRDLNFSREFKFLLLKRLITFFSVLPLALYLRNFWALILGIVFGRVASVCLSFGMHPYRPWVALSERRDLMRFSSLMVVNNLIGFLKLRSPDFIVGRMMGPSTLGVFNMGSEIASMVTAELSGPINRAVLPNLSAQVADERRLCETYLTTLGLTAVLVFPSAAGLAALAGPIVTVALGQKWLAAIPILQIMAGYGAITALQGLGYTALLATNRPGALIVMNAVHVACFLVVGVLAIKLAGIEAMAFSFLCVAILFMPFNVIQVRKQLGYQYRDVCKVLARPLVAAVFMGAALSLVEKNAMFVKPHNVAMLAGEIGAGVVLYTGFLWSIWVLCRRPVGGESVLLAAVQSLLRRIRAPV